MKLEDAVERIFLAALTSLILLALIAYFIQPANPEIVTKAVDVLVYLLVGSGSGKLALTVQK